MEARRSRVGARPEHRDLRHLAGAIGRGRSRPTCRSVEHIAAAPSQPLAAVDHSWGVTASSNPLEDSKGRWIFPVAGGEVTQVQVDFAFGLVIETFDDRRAVTIVRIST